jgi:protein-glutamine gamma-glutamyltransferase
MNTTPLLLGAAILFWGWQGDWWLVALPLALLFEGARWIRARADLGEEQQIKLADLNVILIAIAGVYFYVTFGNPRAIMLLFQWLPVLLLPIALLQVFGTREAIDLKVLFWSMRRRPPREAVVVNLGYPYLGLWIIAASAANVRGESFYLGLAALAAWALWLARPRRFPAAAWFALFALAAALGYGGQIGLHNTQLWLEDAVPEWMAGEGSHTDPYRRSSDIGHIGELKQSDRIVLRVRADPGLKTPLLLHSASYDEYFGTSWIASTRTFAKLFPHGSGTAWTLAQGSGRASVDISEHATLGDPVLNLPRGTVAVENLAALSLKRNALGAVQAEWPPGFVSYRALYDPAAAGGEAPGAPDRRLPKAEQALFERVARDLGLKALQPAAAVERVRRFFSDGFEYSTYQRKAVGGQTPLSEFLLNTRSGHCEYFASATVLLLRAANVPARYATGFSVHEWSTLENAWLARERHGHAWARAWVDGAWIDVDTTPPGWVDVEDQGRPWWTTLADWGSWARFGFATWQERASAEQKGLVFGLIGLAVIVWLGWRLLQGKGAPQRSDVAQAPEMTIARNGLDSEFFAIEQQLGKLGFARLTHETVVDWLARIGGELPGNAVELRDLALLHYRYRFDPHGLAENERNDLARRASAWLNS